MRVRDALKAKLARQGNNMQMVSREQFLPTVRLHITGPLEVMLGEARHRGSHHVLPGVGLADP